MQRFPRALVLALTLAAAGCVDEDPSSPATAPGTAKAAAPWPGRTASAFMLDAPGGITPLLPTPFAPGIVFEGNDQYVVGTISMSGPAVGFIAFDDFSNGVSDDEAGAWTTFNGKVAGGFLASPATTTPVGPGLPILVLFDFNGTDLPTPVGHLLLPLPDGGIAAEVHGLGTGIRPIIVGTVHFGDASMRAVRWVFNTGLSEYQVSILPGASVGQNSKALDLNRFFIVGEMNGHPAYWPVDNPAGYVEHTGVTGGFMAINAGGTAVGTDYAGGGLMGPVAGPLDLLSFSPSDINDQGYVVGAVSGSLGVLRLRTGAMRLVPPGFGEPGEVGGLPFFVTNNGFMGGVVFASGFFFPQLWRFATDPDTDGDKIPDGLDNCPTVINRDQADADSDHVGDSCVPPIAAITASHLTRPEGAHITFDGAGSTDPFDLRLSYLWNFDDGTPNSTARRVRHSFPDNGTFDVVLTVNNGRVNDTETLAVTITNVVPTLTVTPNTMTPAVGANFMLTLDLADAGANDVLDWRVLWADGSAASRGTCATNPCSVNANHVFAAAGTYELRITVNDDDGGTRTSRVTVTASEMD